MSWFFVLTVFGAGVAAGAWVARRIDPAHRLGRSPEEGRRLRDLERRILEDRKLKKPDLRLELCEYHLQHRDPRAAGGALGDTLREHPGLGRVRAMARKTLRGLLLHELRDEDARPAGLLPQDINWHPGNKRVLMRLKDLTLGGLVELKHLDIHIDDFEPLMRKQPLPRVVACRAVVSEEKLDFVLDSRIDWSQTPMEDFRILFRDGKIHVLGTVRLGLPIGFRVTAVTSITGASRLKLSFPHPPRVAGLVPLPIDTVLKIVQRKIEEKLPGAVTSEEEATLEVDILKCGVPPVELNLREIRLVDGRFEILCAAEEVDVETLEALRLPHPSELLPPPEPPPEAPDGEEAKPDEAPGEEEAPGVLESLKGLFGGGEGGPMVRAVKRAEELREKGELGQALQALLGVSGEADPADPDGARVLEALAEIRLDIGGEDNRVLARELLEAVLERQPERARSSFLLGRTHFEQEQFGPAEDRVRMACELAPFEEEPYRLLERIYELRGAEHAAQRAREIHLLLHSGRWPDPDVEGPPTPRGVLFPDAFARLQHPDERSPTGHLVESIQGSLGWLDPSLDPAKDDRKTWPLSAEEFPRLARLAEHLALGLQVRAPEIVIVAGEEQGEFLTRGSWKPWIEAPAASLPGLDERALAFELARSMHQVRTGRGFFTGLVEGELDLLYALLRAVSEEAHRVDTRVGGITGRTLERVIEDTVDTLAQGWVIRGKDLDPWVAADVRHGARSAALEYQEANPGYLALQAWQWALEAGADRTGLLFSGSVGAALRAMRLGESRYWKDAEEDGLGALAVRVREDRMAYRVQELLRFAVSPSLEDLERELFS